MDAPPGTNHCGHDAARNNSSQKLLSEFNSRCFLSKLVYTTVQDTIFHAI